VTQFEEAIYKVLGRVIFLLFIVIILQSIGCACPVPPPPSDYIDEVETSHLV
tara:strand:- start:117 stop:272 length:156 start_codon:yes stop_codon:yes gene_type:complete